MEELYVHEGTTYNVSADRLDEFLTKFQGAVKASEAGKTNGSSKETSAAESKNTGSDSENTSSVSEKPRFTFDKSLFDKEDEDVVGLLKAEYETVFDFEEVKFDPKVGFSGVKASLKSDPSKSITVETNIRAGRTENVFTGGDLYGVAGEEALQIWEANGKKDLDSPIWNEKSLDKNGRTVPLLSQKQKNIIKQYLNEDKALQGAYDDLTSFLTENITKNEAGKLLKRRQEIKRVVNNFNESVTPDLEFIENKYSFDKSPGLFDKEFIQDKGDGLGSLYNQFIAKQPYEKELKQAAVSVYGKDWEKKNINPLEDKKVLETAREIIIENERTEVKKKKIVEILEELEDGEILPASLAHYSGDEELLKNMLTVGTEMFNQEYAAKVELLIQETENLSNNKEVQQFNKDFKNLDNPDFQYEIKPGEETVKLENGKTVPKAIVDDIQKRQQKLKPLLSSYLTLQKDVVDNRENIVDGAMQLNLLKRDYNDWEARSVGVVSGFRSLFANVGGGMHGDNPYANARWRKNINKIQERKDEYAPDISFDDAFSSPTSFGKFVGQEFSNQASIFATLAVPYVGWGTLLASSYGEQYATMTEEEIAGIKDYSTKEKFFTSMGYAVPELAFELLTTVPLLRGAGNALKGLYGNSFRELVEVGVGQFAKQNAPGFVRGSVLESLGEGATTVTQNLVTGQPWHENVDHSMFSGLMFGTTLSAVPLASGAIKNVLGDYKSSEDFRNNLKETNKLVEENKNLNNKIINLKGKKTKQSEQLIEEYKNQKNKNKEKIKDLANANELILKKQNENIIGKWTGWGQINQNGMSAGAMKGYLLVTKQQEQLRIQAEKIQNKDYLSESEKQKQLKDLYQNGATINGQKIYGWQTLQNVRDKFRNQKNSEFNLWAADKNNKAEYDALLEDADNYLNNIDSKGTPSWVKSLKTGTSDREDVARIIWNTRQIKKNLEEGNGNTKISKSLEVFDTVEDAVAAMEKDPDSFSPDLIKAVKNGAHGFDGVKNNSYIIVENMAKDDRLETKTHELSHRFLTNAVQADPQAFREISETIFEWARENDQQLYNRLMGQALTVDSAPDEILAVFLEEAAAERIDLKKKGIAGVVGWLTGKTMKDNYGVTMDFAGESDVIKMLIGLGKKLKAGKLTLKDQAAFLKSMNLKKADTKGKANQVMMDQLNQLRDALGLPPLTMVKLSAAMGDEGSQTTTKSTLFKETNDALIEALELYGIPNPERLLSEDIEVRKELAKEWENLGDSRLWLGSLIGEKWKKFLEVNYLQKRDKAANYDLYKDQIIDVAATGIEKGDNGIPFLVRSWKPSEEGGRTLTSHIFGEIETRLMAKGGIIDRKFPQFDKFTSSLDMSRDDGGLDIEGDLGIEAVLAAEERKRKRKENLEEDRYRKLIGVDDKLAAEIKNEIKEVLLSGNLGLISDFEWTQRFSKSAQKKLFTLIKKQMKDYDAFLKKTRLPFIKHAHTSDLVQMEKMEGKKIFAKLKSENTSPLQIKLGFLEGLIQPFEVKSMTSGPNIYDKLTPAPQEFIDFMRVRGRKDAYVKNNINIMAMDAVFDVLLNQTVEVDGKQVRVLDQFIKQQQDLGLPSASNVLSIVKERINRDQDVKFSKTVRDFNPAQMAIFYDSLSTLGSGIDLINVGDEDAMRTLVNEVYGGFIANGKAVFTETQLKNLTKDLFKLVKQYAVIDKNHTNLKTKPKETLVKYLYNEVDAGVLQETLRDVLDIKDNLATAFDNTARIKNQRAAIIDLGKSFIKTYGRKQALMMMIHAGGMYSTSTQIGRGNHIVDTLGNVVKITKDQITKRNLPNTFIGSVKEKFSSQRYQSFEGKKDWNNNVLKILFPEIQLTDAGNLTKLQTLNGVKGKVDVSLLSESSDKGMQDRDFAAREAQAKLSEIIVRDLAQYYKDKISGDKLDKVDFGMLMMSMASNMQSPLKRAANLKYIYKEKAGKKYKGKLRYEHMIPTNFMVLSITDAYMSKNSDIDLDALFKEYTVAIIPVAMDDIFEEMGMVYTMPFGYDGKQTSRVRYYNMKTFGHPDLYAIESIDPKDKGKVYGEDAINVKFSKNINEINISQKIINEGRKINKKPKGITVLDFDDTLATSKSLIRYTTPEGTKGTLTPEQYASTYQDLQDLGYDFDFSEFNKVVDGKVAPLFQKALKLQSKFGNNDMFVLTARPAESAPAIFAFLKANGLNIPLKNITGLANSTSEAKALWVAEKVGEGYNDFYFADDALQNVQAVKNMLDQFDVKSKVQQARVKFSDTINDTFNDIIEDITGIESNKRFDFIKARKRGASKGKFRIFIPPSHEDFVGLLYNFMGKGRKGDAHRAFLEQALIRPLNRANKEYDTARQSIATDYKNLNKQMPEVKKMLTKATPDGDFTYQDAVRIYIWDKHGYDIPGLSPIDQKNLVELVKSDENLQAYAEAINLISKQEKYVSPTEGWDSGDLRMDLDDATGRVGREQFFAEFIENADIIFSTENLNKIEAGYGKGVREALEDMLYRIKTGRNRPAGQNKIVNNLMNYLNGSVGSVMFLNIRSALLQQMSLVNYINFADNNIFAAAKAFADQKQYWKDWSMIFNSDMLKQRRGGIQTDVNGAELAAEMRKSKNPHRFLISKLLQLGFLPTQIGDNIAIATGGATFYRNRVNKYLKDGLSQKEAETKAFNDFQDITQSTQQSARPDMVSQQQASVIGKVILNFQNVTSQFNRLGKKAFQDIYNRRITPPNGTQMQSDISNAARITYYFAVQNAIFYTLQTALFAMMFDDDEEDNNNLFLKKQERLINGSIDSILRGSGVAGAVLSTLKNVAIAFARQRDVNYNPDESAVIVEALNFSPVLGIKARKVVNAEKTLNYNKKLTKHMETFDIDNPHWAAYTNYVEGFTNIPLNRLYQKTQNVRQGLNNEHEAWERTLMILGWSQYNLNLKNSKMEALKKKSKKTKSKKTTIPF